MMRLYQTPERQALDDRWLSGQMPDPDYTAESKRLDETEATYEAAEPKHDGWKVILIWLAVAIVPWAIIGGFIWSAAR
jgi:hypothetical protein